MLAEWLAHKAQKSEVLGSIHVGSICFGTSRLYTMLYADLVVKAVINMYIYHEINNDMTCMLHTKIVCMVFYAFLL